MTHVQFWIAVSSYYRQQVPDDTMRMYVADIKHIPVENLMKMFEQYRRDTKNRFMPMPAFFLEKENPKTSMDAQAQLVPILIQEAIQKFGWNKPEQSRAHIGELGWRLVEMRGGWITVCENLGSEWQIGTFHAQTRDAAKALLESNYVDSERSYLSGSNKVDQSKLLNSLGLTPKDI